MIHSHHIFDVVAGVVLVCSLVGSVLPPYEVFAFAPRFQVVYRIIVVFISTIGALNLRNLLIKLYPSYQATKTGVPDDVSKETRTGPGTGG